MIRRKDVVRFGSESLLQRTHSFDFEVPASLIQQQEEGAIAHVPLGFWWKALGKYSNIDFEDEEGTSLPLSTSSQDEWLTLRVLFEFSTRILHLQPAELDWKTIHHLSMIVEQDPVWARAEVKDWRKAAEKAPVCPLDGSQTSPPQMDVERAFLAQDEEFLALLEISAMASIFTVVLRDQLEARRVIKLRYDETCSGRRGTDTFLTHSSWWTQWRESARTGKLLLGLAPYEVDLANAFVRAQRYHFEGDAPVGLRYTNVRYKTARKPEFTTAIHSNPRVHLIDSKVMRDTYFSVRGSLVVVDEWVTLALICTAAALAVLMGVILNIGSLDPTASQNVIALAVLVPSIATSIVWRRVHWLVTRLQGWLRFAFGSIGLLLFYLALRVAVSPTSTTVEREPAHESGLMDGLREFLGLQSEITVSRLEDAAELKTIAWICFVWTAIVGLVLFAAWRRSQVRE
jgi:hypothetical protein